MIRKITRGTSSIYSSSSSNIVDISYKISDPDKTIVLLNGGSIIYSECGAVYLYSITSSGIRVAKTSAVTSVTFSYQIIEFM